VKQWFERIREREAARPRTAIDHWIQRHAEYVRRLPKWLVGSVIVGAFALGISWSATGSGPMRWAVGLYGESSAFPYLVTTMSPVLIAMIALYVLARVLRPKPPSSLPTARARGD
jgi:hypothetical protein